MVALTLEGPIHKGTMPVGLFNYLTLPYINKKIFINFRG